MTFAHRIQFFLPVRRCGAETQTDDVDPPKTPKETVVDRLRAADTDWLLRREVIPPLPMDRALVKGFNTRLGFYYTTLKDDSFDVLTPPPDLYGDVTAGLVFNFYDTRFIVQTPGPDKKQLCFSYCENIFGVLKSLETGEITRELALIIDKLDSRAYSNGEIVVTVNDYRYGGTDAADNSGTLTYVRILYSGARNTADIEHGVNDVDDFISGYVRTDKANISFNGAWAQNVKENDMYIDFMGDKGGARLIYGGKFTFTDGKTLESVTPEYDIPDMYLKEDKAFVESIETGVKNKGNIENVLETALLLDRLYASAEKHEEIKL